MAKAAARDALVAYLDEYLEIGAWSDKSLNGLQVDGPQHLGTLQAALARYG